MSSVPPLCSLFLSYLELFIWQIAVLVLVCKDKHVLCIRLFYPLSFSYLVLFLELLALSLKINMSSMPLPLVLSYMKLFMGQHIFLVLVRKDKHVLYRSFLSLGPVLPGTLYRTIFHPCPCPQRWTCPQCLAVLVLVRKDKYCLYPSCLTWNSLYNSLPSLSAKINMSSIAHFCPVSPGTL